MLKQDEKNTNLILNYYFSKNNSPSVLCIKDLKLYIFEKLKINRKEKNQ